MKKSDFLDSLDINDLEKKRDIYEKKLQILKNTIDHTLLTMHRIQSKNPTKAKQLCDILEKITNEQKQIKVEIATIEELLEELENSQEAKTSPVNAAIKQQLSEKKAVQDAVNQIYFPLKEIDLKFKTASLALSKSKNRSLLELLFGRNPKVVCAILLHQISQDFQPLELILRSLLEDHRHPEPFLRLYNHFRHYFLDLKKEVETPWKNSLFKEKFNNYKDRFARLFEDLEQLKLQTFNE